MQAQQDIVAALAQLTVEEKARLLACQAGYATAGVDHIGVVSARFDHASHGLAFDARNGEIDPDAASTCFPTPTTLACSFDAGLAEAVGQAVGEEARAYDTAVVGGPELGGWRPSAPESVGEDPLLAGKMTAAWIRGVQSVGAGALCGVLGGAPGGAVPYLRDDIVDERALHEFHLRAFEVAVREGRPWAVSVAPGYRNGIKCAEDAALLQNLLREEWGFSGAVVALDDGPAHSAQAVAAGCDLVAPGPQADHAEAAAHAVATGDLDAAALDAAAARVLEIAARHEAVAALPCACDMQAHFELARDAATRSAVLLANNGVLPLAPRATVALIGTRAKTPLIQPAQGHAVNPYLSDDAWGALQAAGVSLAFAEGYDEATGEATEDQIAEAERAARVVDVPVVFVVVPEGGAPLSDSVNNLVARVCAANERTVAVLVGQGPCDLPWRGRCAALLYMGYAGCGAGQALADLLTGYAEPTGRLAFTWPASCEEAAAFTPVVEAGFQIVHRESLFSGYRFYDTANAPVAYPFGHGVGYAHFSFPSMRLIATETHYVAECTVRNVSSRDGVETVQVYVHAQSPSLFKPYQVLAGFAKVAVAAGEEATVRIELDDAAFSFWDAASHGWVIEEGPYEILVGTSSRAVRLAQTFTLVRTECPDGLADRVRLRQTVSPARKRALLPYYRVGAGFTDAAFRTLYGGPLPEPRPSEPVTLEAPISALGRTGMGRRMRDSLLDRVGRTLAHGEELAIDETQTPLRALLAYGLPRAELDAAASMANGHIFRGTVDYLRAWMRTWGSR